jgi:hypothetical protein
MEEMCVGVSSSNSAFDKERFSDLISKLRGTRNLAEMSSDTGMSVSFLTKALSQQLPSRPSKRSLMKLTDPNAKPQYNITLSSLLDACGYTQIDEDESPMGEDTRCPGKKSFTEAVSLYFDNMPITHAMSMLVSTLIAKGIGPQVSIQLREGYFEIEDRDKDFQCVGINGFCQDDSGIQAMELVVKTRIFDALCDEENLDAAHRKVYYILTDNKKLFEACIMKLPCIHSKGTVILYTEDHVRFSDEYRKSSGAEQKDLLPSSII